MQTLVWLRMPGDVIFSVGVGMLALFVFRLFVGKRRTPWRWGHRLKSNRRPARGAKLLVLGSGRSQGRPLSFCDLAS